MTDARQLGPRDWVVAAARTLASDGLDGVRVERLARTLGVTKGSFYWHFKNRDALMMRLLATYEQDGTHDIIAEVERLGGGPRDRLRRLWELASTDDTAIELAIRDWARTDTRAAASVDRVDAVRLAFLRRVLRELDLDPLEVEARGLLLYSLLVGQTFIHAHHAGLERAEVVRRAVEVVVGST